MHINTNTCPTSILLCIIPTQCSRTTHCGVYSTQRRYIRIYSCGYCQLRTAQSNGYRIPKTIDCSEICGCSITTRIQSLIGKASGAHCFNIIVEPLDVGTFRSIQRKCVIIQTQRHCPHPNRYSLQRQLRI